MNNKPKPVGWATTISTLVNEIPLAWKSVMTIENSPLRKLDPRVSHMIFQCLAFIWSGLFAIMIGSYMAFGISAIFHVCLITGIFVTAVMLNEADKRPQTFKPLGGYNGRGRGGEHE